MPNFTETGQFLSKISMTYTAKNKLHEALLESITRYDRVYMTDPQDFQYDLEALIKKLSEEHARCTPLKMTVYNHRGTDIRIIISDIVHMDVLIIQGEFKYGNVIPYLPVADRIIKRKLKK